jgi:hypothetical protein
MLENGHYSAWFKTPQGTGTANIILTDGMIAGRDNVLEYRGSYEQDGDRFTAIVEARRFRDGLSTLIGIDEFELKLDGRTSGAMAFCSGTLEQVPGLTLEVALIRSGNEPSAIEPFGLRRTTPFDATKFPLVNSRW